MPPGPKIGGRSGSCKRMVQGRESGNGVFSLLQVCAYSVTTSYALAFLRRHDQLDGGVEQASVLEGVAFECEKTKGESVGQWAWPSQARFTQRDPIKRLLHCTSTTDVSFVVPFRSLRQSVGAP